MPGPRKRIRTTFVQSGGGGGAPPTVANLPIGPDFGDPSDDNTFTARASVALTDLAVNLDGPAARSSVALTDMRVDGLEAGTARPDLVELTYDVVYLAGAVAASNVGADAWTNPTNAQGVRDGTEASRAGGVAAVNAQLLMSYANFSGGIENTTISLVELRYDTRQTGTVLNNGSLRHQYRIGAVPDTVLEIFTGDVDNNPITYDITSVIGGDWAKLNDLETRVRFSPGAGAATVTGFCDAVELRVVSTQTVTL